MYKQLTSNNGDYIIMRLSNAKKLELFKQAVYNSQTGGLQNMSDISKAILFAKKKGYYIPPKQELRSLITEYDEVPILMFVLALENNKDIVVFHKGTIRYTTLSPGAFLTTKPFAILDISKH